MVPRYSLSIRTFGKWFSAEWIHLWVHLLLCLACFLCSSPLYLYLTFLGSFSSSRGVFFLEKFHRWGPLVVHLKISLSCWKSSTGLVVLGGQLFSPSPLKLWFHFLSHRPDEGIVCFSHHLSLLAASQTASFILAFGHFNTVILEWISFILPVIHRSS